MDPGEDIIDILYNKNLDVDDQHRGNKSPSKIQSSNIVSHQQQPRYGFEYHNPPARNYYDDLFQIQRRQFHGLDSVYGIEKRPALHRTDSGTYFSFPSPSRQEKQRRSLIYGQLRAESNNRLNIEWSSKSGDENHEDFLTPESEEPIYDKWSSSVELSSNGIIQEDNKDDRISSNNSHTDGGIYNSIDSGIHEYCSISREEDNSAATKMEAIKSKWKPLVYSVNNMVGLLVMVYLGHQWSNYLQTLHENDMWFSNIKELEREISFRTEQGLYYSYFKHLIKSASISQGVSDLKNDNHTEHGHSINVWQRFNIYQELVIALLQRYVFNWTHPILFYVEFVFSLQGFHATMLFFISWSLSGTWASGVVTMALLIGHRHEITRVPYTVPLREHFSLPFFYAMLVSIARYLEKSNEKSKKDDTIPTPFWSSTDFCLVQVFFMTFLFLVTWQFSQFALLLHSVVCFMLASTQVIGRQEVSAVFGVQLLAVMVVWYCQYWNAMVINSLVVSFLPLAILSLLSQKIQEATHSKSLLQNISLLLSRTALVIIASLALNMTIKALTVQNSDNHIYKFVGSWIGLQEETDFDTRLYRCLAVFRPLSWDMFKKMMSDGALIVYAIFMLFHLVRLTLTLLRKWYLKEKSSDQDERDLKRSGTLVKWLHQCNQNPHATYLLQMDKSLSLTYHVSVSAIFAILGILMARMVVFWSPYVMIMTSVALCDKDFWYFLIRMLGGAGAGTSASSSHLTFFIRHLVLAFILLALYLYHQGIVIAQLEELREFWDPDTVDLMEWINQNTPPTAAFAGTMQLMAGVRLCTLRPITNHPHYEDKHLRERTKELYKMYGQFSAEEVHQVLLKFDASFIILEDSQCLSAGRNADRCAMPDTVDLAYGHIPADGHRDPPHLIESPHPRFCDAIRFGSPEYTKYFRLVFHNKTFRVYAVKKD